MTFYSLNRTTSPLPVHLGDGTPIVSILDVLQYEPRGLAIDAISDKVLIRDIENRSLDRFVSINPANPADSIFTFSGSQKFIMRADGTMALTAVGEIPLDHKYNAVTGLYVPKGILIEPQGTNLMTNAGLNTTIASWSITTNVIEVPNFDFGNFIADGIRLDNSVSTASAFKSNATTTGQFTFSCFCYSDDGDPPVFGSNTFADPTNDFILSTSNIADDLPTETMIDQLGPKLFKISVTGTGTGTTASIGPVKYSTNTNRQFVFTGFQLDESDHPTSLIETSVSTVTRSADDLSLSLPFWSNEGMTVIAEFEYYGDPAGFSYGRQGTSIFTVMKNGTNKFNNHWTAGRYLDDFYGSNRNEGQPQSTIFTVGDAMPGNGPHKIAFSFDNTQQQVALNGGDYRVVPSAGVMAQDLDLLDLSAAYNGDVGQKHLTSFVMIPRAFSQAEILQGSQL